MKRVIFPIIAVLFTLPGLAQADSAYGSLQAVHEKNTVMKDLRKICTPQGSPSDEVWEKRLWLIRVISSTSAKPFWQFKETIKTTTGKRLAKLNARIYSHYVVK